MLLDEVFGLQAGVQGCKECSQAFSYNTKLFSHPLA